MSSIAWARPTTSSCGTAPLIGKCPCKMRGTCTPPHHTTLRVVLYYTVRGLHAPHVRLTTHGEATVSPRRAKAPSVRDRRPLDRSLDKPSEPGTETAEALRPHDPAAVRPLPDIQAVAERVHGLHVSFALPPSALRARVAQAMGACSASPLERLATPPMSPGHRTRRNVECHPESGEEQCSISSTLSGEARTPPGKRTTEMRAFDRREIRTGEEACVP